MFHSRPVHYLMLSSYGLELSVKEGEMERELLLCDDGTRGTRKRKTSLFKCQTRSSCSNSLTHQEETIISMLVRSNGRQEFVIHIRLMNQKKKKSLFKCQTRRSCSSGLTHQEEAVISTLVRSNGRQEFVFPTRIRSIAVTEYHDLY